MSTKKIAVFVGSRANYGRLKMVISKLKEHPRFELVLVVGASAYNTIDFDYPVVKLQCCVDGDNHSAMAITTGLLTTQIASVLDNVKPDIALVHGDRYECLAFATACAYMRIPLAHTEGGELTGCIDDKVRNAITSLADIHFPVTELAMLNIGGYVEDIINDIHIVGSPAIDYVKSLNLVKNVQDYIVILHHPETSVDEDITPMIEALDNFCVKKYWINPNNDAGAKALSKLAHKQDVEFVKGLSPEKFYELINNCVCLVGNTSAGIKEGAYLGVPYVSVGNRQKSRECAYNVFFADYDKYEIINAIEHQIATHRYRPSYLFGDGTASEKIVKVLEDYFL